MAGKVFYVPHSSSVALSAEGVFTVPEDSRLGYGAPGGNTQTIDFLASRGTALYSGDKLQVSALQTLACIKF